MRLVQMQPGSLTYDSWELGQTFGVGVRVPEQLASCTFSPGDLTERVSIFLFSPQPSSGFLATTIKCPPLPFLCPQCSEAGAEAAIVNQRTESRWHGQSNTSRLRCGRGRGRVDIGIHLACPLNKSPFPRPVETRSGRPRAGAQRPHGARRSGCCAVRHTRRACPTRPTPVV